MELWCVCVDVWSVGGVCVGGGGAVCVEWGGGCEGFVHHFTKYGTAEHMERPAGQDTDSEEKVWSCCCCCFVCVSGGGGGGSVCRCVCVCVCVCACLSVCLSVLEIDVE